MVIECTSNKHGKKIGYPWQLDVVTVVMRMVFDVR